jgi:hypothetical protein
MLVNGVGGTDRQPKEIDVYVILIIVLAVMISIGAMGSPVSALIIAIPGEKQA